MSSLPSEETPLLSEPGLKHEAVYERFSNPRKRIILFLVSWCGLLPCMYAPLDRLQSLSNGSRKVFVAGSFLPSIPQIAKDLESTGPIVRSIGSCRYLSSKRSTDSCYQPSGQWVYSRWERRCSYRSVIFHVL